MSEHLTVALWATNLAPSLSGLDEWAAGVEARLREAKDDGADLLVMPEYMAEQWLSFAPADLAAHEEIPWLARRAPAALGALEGLVRRHGLALLAGTMPVEHPNPEAGRPPYLNRAWLVLPDGRTVGQDKLCLTPGERNPAAWNLGTGSTIEIVEWRGLRLATLICLDVEMPALAGLLAPQGLDLVLAPSMTEQLSGYTRVFSCAKARAVELLAAVGAVGCVGRTATGRPRAANISGAALYLPCEEALGHTGVLVESPPRRRAEGHGPVLIARDIPIGLLRELRRGRAEVWPGAWRADHVRLVEHAEGPALGRAASR